MLGIWHDMFQAVVTVGVSNDMHLALGKPGQHRLFLVCASYSLFVAPLSRGQ